MWMTRSQFHHDVAAPGLPGYDRPIQPQRVDDSGNIFRRGGGVVPGCRYVGLAVATQVDGSDGMTVTDPSDRLGQRLRDSLPKKSIRSKP